ncbi:MAG: hypothetical protein Fur0034_06950 [Desulfuromonadia bacterium]
MTMDLHDVFPGIGTGGEHREKEHVIDPLSSIRVDENSVDCPVALDTTRIEEWDQTSGKGEGVGAAETDHPNTPLPRRSAQGYDSVTQIPHPTL